MTETGPSTGIEGGGAAKQSSPVTWNSVVSERSLLAVGSMAKSITLPTLTLTGNENTIPTLSPFRIEFEYTGMPSTKIRAVTPLPLAGSSSSRFPAIVMVPSTSEIQRRTAQ